MRSHEALSNNDALHTNCLNTIRLIAAISVMYLHAINHMNVHMPVLITKIISFFQGVPIFFAMSGFLVWESVKRSSDFISYGKKRFLRIYPELWGAVLLGAITILIFYDEAIRWVSLGAFMVTQGTILQFWTPDFLRGFGCGTPNGALWTIGVTVQFYLVIYFLHKLLRSKGIKAWLIVLLSTVLAAVLSPVLGNVLPATAYKLYWQTVIPYAWMFFAGILIAANRNLLMPFLRKYWMVFWVASFILKETEFDILLGGYRLFSCWTLIAGVIGFAYQFPVLNIKTDISYGIYIYHMIVVNVMIALGYIGKPIYLALVVIITCLIAFASERTIGRCAMKLKSK